MDTNQKNDVPADKKKDLNPTTKWLVYVLVAAGLTWFVWMVIPAIQVYRNTPPEDRARIQMRLLVGCILAYQTDTGEYPENLADLLKQPDGVENWQGGYGHKKLLTDPWHNDYAYRLTDDPNRPYELFSCGPDEKPDTEDDIKTLVL